MKFLLSTSISEHGVGLLEKLHIQLRQSKIELEEFSNKSRVPLISKIRVSSGSIASDYGLDDRAIGVRSPAQAKDFSSSLCVQTGSGAHPASCTMGTGGPFPRG
jgi:hypothetical protein